MSPRLKSILQYLIIITAIVLLIGFSLQGIKPAEGEDKWDYLVTTWKKANKGWLFAMALIMMISHVVRAERWKMMFVPTGYRAKLGNSFLSVMVGYIVNLVIPRGGEVSRCYNLYKLDKIPADISFGTVVVERVVDLICFLILVILVFLVESQKLFAFLGTLPVDTGSAGDKIRLLLFVLLGGAALLFISYFIIRKNQKLKSFLITTWKGIRIGLLTISKMKQKGIFIFYSLAIWFLYFLTSYAVILAFPSTQHLGLSAVISLFGIGSLAMLVPLPGGTGSYHTLVPAGLTFLYQIPQSDAKAFVFVFHAWQTFLIIVVGGISLVITSLYVKKSGTSGAAPAKSE
jgi:uncharacterized membrane protein YbhN (UPF0104 family)